MTKRLFPKTILILALLGFAPSAFADHVEVADRAWAEAMRDARRANTPMLQPIDLGTNTLPTNTRIKLAAIAESQTQIWGDSILEGDFQAENRVQIDSVENVFVNGVMVGYRIVYSSVAIDASQCDPDKSVSDCVAGRIVEATFVSTSLESWIRDDRQLAEFVSP